MGKQKEMRIFGKDISPFLEEVVGSDRGRIFEIVSANMKIGRTEENDVVVPSNSVSKHHAAIERSEEGYYVIRDLGSKNGIQVNGRPVESVQLSHRDLIQIGDFAFRFQDPSSSRENQLVEAQGLNAPTPVVHSRNRRPMLYFILAIVVGVSCWILLSGPDNKESEVSKSNTSETGEERQELSGKPPNVSGIEDPVLSRAGQRLEKLDISNSALKEAELYFRRGQREYLNRNYHRAIEAFQTALAFHRGHTQAWTYLRFADTDAVSEATKHREMAIKYFQSLQYSRAAYHFNEVVSLLSHRQTDTRITEAKQYIEESKRMLQAAELFP